MNRHLLLPALLLTGVSGCGPSYSPDTYATNAVQQANKAEQGVVVGVRPVAISASGAVGTVSGAAAGGIAGAQVGAGPISAFSALGGSLVGGLAGSAVEHATADTKAFEYIVRKVSGELVSVTQKDTVPLALGEKVLVIAGNQARVVPDYTVALPGTAGRPDGAKATDARPAEAKAPEAKPSDGAGGSTAPGASLPASVSATPLPVPDMAAAATTPSSAAIGTALTRPNQATTPALSGPATATPATATSAVTTPVANAVPASTGTPPAVSPPAVAAPIGAALGGSASRGTASPTP